MAAAHDILIGSLTALVAIFLVTAFIFGFVVAPLVVGGGFVVIFLLYQLVFRRSQTRR